MLTYSVCMRASCKRREIFHLNPDEEHQSSKHVDCIYPRLIKQQSNLLNGVGFGVIINFDFFSVKCNCNIRKT